VFNTVTNPLKFVTFVYLFIIPVDSRKVKGYVPDPKLDSINTCSVNHHKKMKRLLFAFSLFFTIPVSAAEITSKITDSVQLKVDGAAVQSTRIGASYSASGTNIQATSFGGVGGAGTYDINTPGQAFSFSETINAADTPVTTQTVTNGVIGTPNLYGDSVTQVGGEKGTLAGTLSPTGVPTVTAGGAGTSATAQRSIELSVFK
jgi:hypothetical protein